MHPYGRHPLLLLLEHEVVVLAHWLGRPTAASTHHLLLLFLLRFLLLTLQLLLLLLLLGHSLLAHLGGVGGRLQEIGGD
jgi:hypothetical protein